ncbi:unnamed protein product [Protopolystoma xenopodis]|uniref:RNA helicase n=1 Tax=Protopolystoma xenopodis TaxID=117903 RepID=A0A3S5B6D5_9PLAT|nr:unnamed protein product [Protopolystoma xenopodis]
MSEQNCAPTICSSSSVTILKSFKSMCLNPMLLKGLYENGFERPSVIQQKGIKPIVEGRDVFVQAQSGTGKTATFAVGVLERIDQSSNDVQAIILAPTRELALQIAQVVVSLGDYMNVKCMACYGGRTDVSETVRRLAKGVHIIVGTPGKVLG